MSNIGHNYYYARADSQCSGTGRTLPPECPELTAKEHVNLVEHGLLPRRPSPIPVLSSGTLRRGRLVDFYREARLPPPLVPAYSTTASLVNVPDTIVPPTNPPVFHPGTPPDWFPKYRWTMWFWDRRHNHVLTGAIIFFFFLCVALAATVLWLTVGNRRQASSTTAKAQLPTVTTSLLVLSSTTAGLAEMFPTGFISIPKPIDHSVDDEIVSAADPKLADDKIVSAADPKLF